MSKFNPLRLTAFAVASLLVVSLCAACGTDDQESVPAAVATATQEPTAAPTEAVEVEPTEVMPEPTGGPPLEPPATPTPDATATPPQIDMVLEDFPIYDDTVGLDLLSQISDDEVGCITTRMGDTGIDRFLDTPIVEAAVVEGTYSVLGRCLKQDSLIAVTVGLVSYTGGGWEQASRECAADITRDYPELMYHILGLDDRLTDGDTSLYTNADLLRFYECLTAEEKVAFNVLMRGEPVLDFSGQDLLDMLTASELACVKEVLPPSEFEAVAADPEMFAGPPTMSPANQVNATACLSSDTLDLIPKEIIVRSLGVISDISRACALGALHANPDYVDLMVEIEESAESLTPEEFVSIANSAFQLLACLSPSEVQFFVEQRLPLVVPQPPSMSSNPSMSEIMDFPIDGNTPGAALLAQISVDESRCVSMRLGDDGYARFGTTPLVEAAATSGTYSVWADCLELNNLISLGVGLMSVTNRGWEMSSRECVSDVVSGHPELLYIAFGLKDRVGELDHPGHIHAEIVDLYKCLTVEEQVDFNVVMRSDPVADFSGSHFLEILPAAEFDCIKSNLSEEAFDDLAAEPDLFSSEDMASSPTMGTVIGCLSPATLERIPRVLIMYNLGVESEDSKECVLAFFDENDDYIPLVVQVTLAAESLTSEEFVTIANDALRIFDCLTVDEILFFQDNYLPITVP